MARPYKICISISWVRLNYFYLSADIRQDYELKSYTYKFVEIKIENDESVESPQLGQLLRHGN